MKHIEFEWTDRQLKEGVALNLNWIKEQEEEMAEWKKELAVAIVGQKISDAQEAIKDIKKDIKKMKKDLRRIRAEIAKRAE